MKRILLVDNYDSFTFNLLHSLEKDNDVLVTVVRNDNLSVCDIEIFEKIVLSPGPGLPNESNQLLSFIARCAVKKPILGICLGHQALGQFFGAKLKNLPEVLHGVQLNTRLLYFDGIFDSFPPEIKTGHYHSWVLDQDDFPACLTITAQNEQGGIMAFKHSEFDITGIQFHPESVLTPMGDTIIRNWLHQ